MPQRLALSLLLCLASLPAWAASNPDAINDLSADEERRLQKGDVIVHVEETHEAIKRTLVVGLIDAPPEVTYPIYADFESYPELFQSARSSDILKREGNVLTCKVVMDFPWPLGTRWVTNHTFLSPESTSFTFKKVEGSVKVYEGALKILPEGKSRSRVVYSAKVDPDLPLPAWVINMVQARYFPMAIERVREKLVKTGYKRPADL